MAFVTLTKTLITWYGKNMNNELPDFKLSTSSAPTCRDSRWSGVLCTMCYIIMQTAILVLTMWLCIYVMFDVLFTGPSTFTCQSGDT